MRVQLATEPAPGRAENEDNAFRAGPLVGILDGVTAPAGIETGCVHSPAWYVQRLTTRLTEAAAASPGEPLPTILAEAIRRVRADHDGRCDLDNPATPAATACLIRDTGNRLDYLILADAFLITDNGDQVRAQTDHRFRNAVAELRRQALTPGTGSEHRRELTRRKYQLTNQPRGYWIAAADPEAAHQAVTGSLPLTGPDRIRRAALLTDGTSCAVTDYQLMTWNGLLDLLTDHGPHELIRRVRHAENTDPDRHEHPRYKRHDDATAALCLFEEPR
ncbi:MAG TPA: hypothetical protein VF174_17180 [Micromonosporaceae bacterium]